LVVVNGVQLFRFSLNGVQVFAERCTAFRARASALCMLRFSRAVMTVRQLCLLTVAQLCMPCSGA